jgi:hypothetical protein
MSFKISVSSPNALELEKEAAFYDFLTSYNFNVNNANYQQVQFFKYSGKEETFELTNLTQNNILLTMVAGGGVGGESRTVGGIQMSGGGGGGGGSFVNVPISVVGPNVSIKLYIGAGGKTLGVNGESSYVVIGPTTYTVTGGKAAIYNTGGEGGTGLQNGTKGENGQAQLPSGPIVPGGEGGQSFLGNNIIGYGAGGKGADVGSTEFGLGEDGIIMISYSNV